MTDANTNPDSTHVDQRKRAAYLEMLRRKYGGAEEEDGAEDDDPQVARRLAYYPRGGLGCHPDQIRDLARIGGISVSKAIERLKNVELEFEARRAEMCALHENGGLKKLEQRMHDVQNDLYRRSNRRGQEGVEPVTQSDWDRYRKLKAEFHRAEGDLPMYVHENGWTSARMGLVAEQRPAAEIKAHGFAHMPPEMTYAILERERQRAESGSMSSPALRMVDTPEDSGVPQDAPLAPELSEAARALPAGENVLQPSLLPALQNHEQLTPEAWDASGGQRVLDALFSGALLVPSEDKAHLLRVCSLDVAGAGATGQRLAVAQAMRRAQEFADRDRRSTIFLKCVAEYV